MFRVYIGINTQDNDLIQNSHRMKNRGLLTKLLLIFCLGTKGQITGKRTGVIGNQYTSINNVESIFDPAFEYRRCITLFRVAKKMKP